eukprot:1190286-Prorocentrum_minimum.AAC.6
MRDKAEQALVLSQDLSNELLNVKDELQASPPTKTLKPHLDPKAYRCSPSAEPLSHPRFHRHASITPTCLHIKFLLAP